MTAGLQRYSLYQCGHHHSQKRPPGFQSGRPGRCWPWLQYIRESSFMYSFCCSGARRQVIEMNSISHSDCPEIGIQDCSYGLWTLYLLFVTLPFDSLAPGTGLCFPTCCPHLLFPSFFFPPSSWILFFYRYLPLVRGESKVGRS